MSKTKVVENSKVEGFVLCTCYAKEDYYCKNWDGKGNVPSTTNIVKEICKNNNTDPDTCEYLVKPILRKGCEWIWKTVCGSPVATTEIVEDESKIIVKLENVDA